MRAPRTEGLLPPLTIREASVRDCTLKFDPSKPAYSMRVSLDKVESSNPILTAAHAGASTGKTGHLQPNASDVALADAEGRLFCVFQTRFPHSSTLQVVGKARFASQNNHFVCVMRWGEGASDSRLLLQMVGVGP